MRFIVSDDSGLMGLVDPDAYSGFVDRGWTLGGLFHRFQREMTNRHMLIWGTGGEGTWRVQVTLGQAPVAHARMAVGGIHVSHGKLCLVSYESLTMAAQFEDVSLPEPHEADCLFDVPAGAYRCSITRVRLAGTGDGPRDRGPDIVVALEAVEANLLPDVWEDVPWPPPGMGARSREGDA